MKTSPNKQSKATVHRLNLRPTLSRRAALFIKKHPSEVTRIVADAIEAAAAMDAFRPKAVRHLPVRLRQLVVAPLDPDAGHFLSVSEAAERLEVTRVTIYAWIEAERLLAWRATRRGILIPAEQIVGPREVVPGMDRVLGTISDPEAAWDFLTQESPYLDPDAMQRPINRLKGGDVDAVIAAARSFSEAFS
jgi:excisionase family DNA binding protein